MRSNRLEQHTAWLQARLPWLRKLLGFSFLFFLLKGLVWTALLAYTLAKGIA